MAEGQHSSPKEFWSGTAIHGALQDFQTIDLALRLTVAPWKFDGNAHGIDVASQRSSKAHTKRIIAGMDLKISLRDCRCASRDRSRWLGVLMLSASDNSALSCSP